eukprot:jgi/Psemu1/250736/estExt_Genewise1Plus.C_210004
MQVDWELSRQFEWDSQGIRVACVLSPSDPDVDQYRIVTGTQGGGLCEFGVPSGSIRPIEFQHNHAVTALLSSASASASLSSASSASSTDTPGFYVSGCKDNLVRVFDSSSHQLKATLTGHEKPVTSMAFVSSGAAAGESKSCDYRYLVTGSWDGTAKVWDIHRQALLATLTGHENSTCVTGLTPTADQPSTILKIATGSAGVAQNNQVEGHTVRVWSVNIQTGEVQCVHSVANDHDGPIRDIGVLGDGDSTGLLATCSNDGSVRLRSSDTGASVSILTFVQEQSPHPPMLLSVAPIAETGSAATTDIVSSAEDGHVVAWNYQDRGNGTVAEPQVILHPSCVWQVIGLPAGDFATCCQDGKLRIFTRASDRMATEAEKEAFVHTVQEAITKKQAGPSAEEVAKFPLWETNLQKRGTSEGQVQLFNKSGTAIAAQWSMASQTWIEVGQVLGSADGGTVDGVQYDHVFPIEVDLTGGGVAKLQIGYNNGENQFVAAQRFIDAHNLPQHHLSEIANYIEQRVKSEGRTLGGPATGAAGGNPSSFSTPSAVTGVPMIFYEHLPVPAYKSFELSAKTATTTLEKMKKKIVEYGHLSDSQLTVISSLMDTLAATNRYHSSRIENDKLTAISDMLESFPPSEVFPALDLARLTVAHPDAAGSSNAKYWNDIVCKALFMCADTSDLEGSAAIAIPMLSLRLFANAFRGGPGSLQAVTSQLESVLRCNEKFINSNNKNIRLSAATLLYNISFYVHSKRDAPSTIGSRVVSQVDAILKSKTYETEAIIRSLMALGTVAIASPEAKETAKSQFVVSRVEMSASPHGETAKALAKEVYNVLS